MTRPGLRPLACVAYVAVLALAAGCASVAGEPTAQSPGPSPQPTENPESTVTPPPPDPTDASDPTSSGPGRQPPLPNADDAEVEIGLDAAAVLADMPADEAADFVTAALASYGWPATRVGDSVVGARTDVGVVRPGEPFHVVTASLDRPADLGLLLTLAHAFRSRSTHLPTVFVAQGDTSYVAQLSAAQQADVVPIQLAVPDGATREELRALAVELLDTI